jgi:phosphatidate cytidylyltransferase
MKISTLYRRSITGLIFGLIVLALILINQLSLHIFVWLIALLCSYEYLQMRSEIKLGKIALWSISVLVGPALPVLNYLELFSFNPILPLVIISVLYHLYLGGRVIFDYQYSKSSFNIIFSCFLYIGLPLLLLNQLLVDKYDYILIINILVVIWASDTFAYLIGSTMGKTKLLSRVSPGKTVEGAIGGVVFSIISGLILYKYLPIGDIYFHLFLAVVIWFFGLLGDLVESHLKRSYNLKDSGTILPGHGGFLDRFDSFNYLLPFVMLYLLLFSN